MSGAHRRTRNHTTPAMAVEGGATSPGPREKLDAQIKSADMVRTSHDGAHLWPWAELWGNRRTTCSRRRSTSVRRPSTGSKHTPGRTDADDMSSSRGNGEIHDREGTQLPSHASLGSTETLALPRNRDTDTLLLRRPDLVADTLDGRTLPSTSREHLTSARDPHGIALSGGTLEVS